MAEFEELNANINRLISELRNKDKKEDKVDLSSLNDFADSTKGYEQYLKEIQANTKGIRESMNTFLKNVNSIETPAVEAETEKLPAVNYGIEEKAFVDYNQELKRLIDKITDLSVQFSDVKNQVSVNVDFKTLDDISEKIKQANIDALSDLDNLTSDIQLNINSDVLDAELDQLTAKLKELEAPIQLSFESNVEELKSLIASIEGDTTALKAELDQLSGVNIGQIDTTTLDSFMAKLSELKDVSLNVDIATNIDEVQAKMAEFRDVNVQVVLNIEDMLSKIDSTQVLLDEMTSKFGVINFDTSVNLTYNVSEIQTEIQNAIAETDVVIKPVIDIDKEVISNTIKAAFTPTIEMPTSAIGFTPRVEASAMDHTLPEQKTEDDSELKEMLRMNTEAITQLQNAIATMVSSQATKPAKTTETQPSGEKKATMTVGTKEQPASMEELMLVLIQGVNNLGSKQSQMLIELKKSIFLKNND
jgi:hypothetical protein